MSRALICVSVSAKRRRSVPSTSSSPSTFTLAAFRASSIESFIASSTFAVARTPETCTAGTSPKRLGAA